MASNPQLLATHNYNETTDYVLQPPLVASKPKLKAAEQDLASFTLLDALDRDDRPSFAIEICSYLHRDEALDIIYANTALHAIDGLLARISGNDATSLFAESSAPQLAFRHWIRGQASEGDLQQRENAYTFEGYVWNATILGRYKVISGVHTRLLWADAAPGGKSHRTLLRERKTPRGKLRADAVPMKPELSRSHKPRRPDPGTSSSPDQDVVKNTSFDCTSDVLASTNPHIDYFRSVDWAKTPLGPMNSWPCDLRCVVNTVLSNNAPAVMFWGDDVIMLYNEQYVQLLGSLHPCMGESVRVKAPDHWASFQPIVDHIKATGESIAEPDMLLFIEKDGLLEETHWSFQFLPILNSGGQVTAYYQSFYEVSNHRILERRVSSLVAMGTESANARDFPSFWETTLRALSLNDKDVPFALLYAAERHISAQTPSLSSPGSVPPLEGCVLKGTIGVSADHPVAPAMININGDSYILHAFLNRAAQSGKAIVVHLEEFPDTTKALEGINWKGYGDPCRTLVICPIIPTTGNQVEGFLIIGINPRRPFDEEYQQYLHVMVRLLATSLASIVLFEDEVRQRENAIIQAAQIQEHLLAELQLKESKFQRFAERSDVGIFIMDPIGNYTYRNQRWYDMFEIASSDSNATEAWYKIAFEEDIAYCQSLFAKLIINHESVCFELRTRMSWAPPSESSESQAEDAQHFKWILCSAYPELDTNGNLVEVVGNVTDISSKRPPCNNSSGCMY
jgi:PAS domain-containing protein